MHQSLHRSAPVIALVFLLAANSTGAAEEVPDPSQLTFERIFEDDEFEVETFGPARWLEDGSGYTTLESAEDVEGAKDIIRYDPATGDRSVLVPASLLAPVDGGDPLSIEDYLWSDDGRRLLIFTNTKKVHRCQVRRFRRFSLVVMITSVGGRYEKPIEFLDRLRKLDILQPSFGTRSNPPTDDIRVPSEETAELAGLLGGCTA